MIKEVLDKNSGAILFKKDPESLRQEELQKKVKEQEDTIEGLVKALNKLNKRISSLEKS